MSLIYARNRKSVRATFDRAPLLLGVMIIPLAAGYSLAMISPDARLLQRESASARCLIVQDRRDERGQLTIISVGDTSDESDEDLHTSIPPASRAAAAPVLAVELSYHSEIPFHQHSVQPFQFSATYQRGPPWHLT